MIKNYLRFLIILVFFCTNLSFAQQRNFWSQVSESQIKTEDIHHKVKLKRSEAFSLELDQIKNELSKVDSASKTGSQAGVKVLFPDSDGNMISFLVRESSVMSPELARKFPKNKSYVGYSEKDKSKRIRFSLNEIGFHAVIMDSGGKIRYIEPLTKDKRKYRVYDRKDLDSSGRFECLAEEISQEYKKSQAAKITDDGILRTYDLALAATGEYSQFHINDQNAQNESDAEKKAIVLAAMTTAITRVNAIFENDLAIHLQLVSKNEDIIYLDPDTDPYTNDDGREMLSENQVTCDNVIGIPNYDIGHVFSTGGGGIATRSSVCASGFKARGVTGSPFPMGEEFYFDFVAHEMGHQFGANHTFNGDEGGCAGVNRNDATAVEPGSGSTLMAYAGLCSSQNVQGKSDLYFHIISIEEIRDYIVNGVGGNCAAESNLIFNQNVPTVDAGEGFTIPKGTPFKLVGEGEDLDGDPVSFCWEQVDAGVTIVPPSFLAKSGASYRSYEPTESNTRYFPKLSTLVTGEISSKWEVTPEVGRDLNFKLTVRDNNTEAGQVVSDEMKITVSNDAGPFVTTSQNAEEIVWTVGEEETITWDVAGTNENNINVTQVNIFLSTDGGKTFPTVLANAVANDGSETITVPNLKASRCFVIVEAVGNIFFSMNTKSFSIGNFNQICNTYDSTDTPRGIPDNNPEGINSVINIEEDVLIEDVKVSLIDRTGGADSPGIVHTWLSDLGIYLTSPSGTIIELVSGACEARENIQAVFSDVGEPLECNNFIPSISGNVKPVDNFTSFQGERSVGNWILTVIDSAPQDIGFLEGWSLEICSSEEVLSVNNFKFDNFKVFPNPSDGNFNIKFRSEETNDVDIQIFDVLGRKVLSKSFINSNTEFDENLNVQNISGGLYILTVKRGNKMSSQKIWIE
ncbi:reprolysin-like metallopeptidase [Lutimonas zeaxanthinifaciens]|uniref:reprolysin-like metallopeptidase n=1 Tax=Lutimonas zeaxanthinifaciens TaxID=3060215 RepID=UPI00265D04AB|nr:zinc-dependent metalloprotease family protein [Lutimonas sp. YSD2104]WKK65495.1 zinc-dependent metalloprotease family protein [Lutimonas sp. YSD2104]